MAKRHVLFIHKGKKFPQLLERELSKLSSWVVDFELLGRQVKPSHNRHYNLVILESKKRGLGALPQEQLQHFATGKCAILAIPSGMLKKNSRRILETVQAFLEDSGQPIRTPSPQNGQVLSQDPLLEDFVERKLKNFVKKSKAGQARNLYTLLLKEIEKPLISLTLKETNGNQIQAALILGMNRNTLRKMIKEHRIPVKRN